MVALNENMPQCQECARRKQAAAKPFARPCLGGETDALPVGRCSPARRGKLLIAGRIADDYVNSTIFTGPGTDAALRQEPKSPGQPGRASGRRAVPREFTDDDVQSSYGGNEIIYCGYPDHGVVMMVIGTGLYDPETDLYYVRNRMYNPALGRWIQRDPLRYTNGANTYQFVVSNPVGNVDPTGLMTDSQFIKWLNDTYHEVPGGGEFVDATGLVPPGVKAWIYTQAEDRAIKDQGMCPPKDFLTDPIYNALMNMAQGQPLTAAEHAAVQEDYDRGARESLWSWFWGQAVKGWDQL